MVSALEDKKAEDIVILDLRGIVSFTDYFVICSATSERMTKALIHAAQGAVKEKYGLKTQVEGEAVHGWLLADYGDVILHVFSTHQRDYYGLENLWSEGNILLHLQ